MAGHSGMFTLPDKANADLAEDLLVRTILRHTDIRASCVALSPSSRSPMEAEFNSRSRVKKNSGTIFP